MTISSFSASSSTPCSGGGGRQAGKNRLHQLLPLRRAADGHLVVLVDRGPARGGLFGLESQHGEPALIIRRARLDPGPGGVGVSILATERDADFQVRVRAIRDQVGEIGRLHLLEVTDAGAGRRASGEERQQQPCAQAAEKMRDNSHRNSREAPDLAPGTAPAHPPGSQIKSNEGKKQKLGKPKPASPRRRQAVAVLSRVL